MSARGFTLIELVITVAIVAILSTIVLPLADLAVQRTREQELRSALREIRGAIDAYRQAVEDGHITKSATDSNYPKSPEILVEGVVDIKSPGRTNIYFLRRIPRDPMNRDSALAPAKTWGLRSYASPPEDPRPGDDVYDVSSLSPGVGLNGIPYREW
jgi:general secretion pathway protein G